MGRATVRGTVAYRPDQTSGDDVHHQLNLDPETLGVARAVVEARLDPESCSSEYSLARTTLSSRAGGEAA